MATLLSLPADILRYHIFTSKSLDAPSLAMSSMVCKRIREFVPANKRKVTINSAVYEGYLEVVQWLIAKGLLWNSQTCECAALNGHLKMLQWLRANDCPWDQWTCVFALFNGHLEALQWAVVNGCPCDESICTYAVVNNQLEALQWLRANGCPWNKENCLLYARRVEDKYIADWINEQT